jgi:hypothetical protein
MNLDFAVERLYQVGWTPDGDEELLRLPDGRRMPSISCVKREFGRAGLQLSVQHAPKFQCYRASWSPAEKSRDEMQLDPASRQGTVVGACEQEAAVYALAQLLTARNANALNV